jgi:hypothetical protein
MTWLNAVATESPVTTAQRNKPKVAGAIVTVEWATDTNARCEARPARRCERFDGEVALGRGSK